MNLRCLILVLCAMIPLACNPLREDDGLYCVNERGNEPGVYGEMSALLNGKPWINSPHHGTLLAYSTEDSELMDIRMYVLFSEDQLSSTVYPLCSYEYMKFYNIPRHLGIYPLRGGYLRDDNEPHGIFRTYDYCDTGEGLRYFVDESKNGFVSIDAYDEDSCTIQGTFALTVVIEEPEALVYPYVDTLRFTDGQFYTHVVTW